MPFAELSERGIRLYYELRGAGPPLAYLGGTGGDLRRAPNALEVMLAKHFRVLMLDQRGMGRSGKPDVPYAMADYAEDAAALLDHVGWARCPVLGYSFGGMVAQELAINRPRMIQKLVLCCTSTGGAGGSSYPLHELDRLPLEERIRLRLMRTDRRIDKIWIAAHPDEYKAMYDKALADARLFAGEPRRAEGASWQLQARAIHDTWDRIGALAMPVLVCGGRYDGQAEPPVVEALAKRIPGAELAFFEGGHGFLNQDPAAYARITAFLQD
jgi:3-oxoadipate enol-lactonase